MPEQVGCQVRSKPAVPRDDPAPVVRHCHASGHGRSWRGGEPGGELVGDWRPHCDQQFVPEQVERVDDDRGAERLHPGDERVVHGAADDRDLGAQQGGPHRDRQVGFVVIGQGDHPGAVRVVKARAAQFVGIARVGAQPRDIGAKRCEIERVDAGRFQVEYDHPAIDPVEAASDDLTRLPEAGHDQKRLAQPPHLALEALQVQRLPEPAVLQQCQHRADGVGPRDHRQVDRDDHPHALRRAERVRDLPEPDRGRRVGHEVERFERVHMPDPAVDHLAGHQREAEDADGEEADENDQRRPHLAQRQEDRRRAGPFGEDPARWRCGHDYCLRKETVSTTSSVTEMMLANSAPPDSDTTLEICSGVRAAPSARLL